MSKYEFFIAGKTRNKDNILKICDLFDKYNISYYCFLKNDETKNSYGDASNSVEENMDVFESLGLKSEIVLNIFNEDMEAEKNFRWTSTPYYLSLIQTFIQKDPIFLQAIPTAGELLEYGLLDPLEENQSNPCGNIVRRYPDRVILNVTNCCASLCRHCQRKRNFEQNDIIISSKKLSDSIKYIGHHPEIRDVLITGGDPLTLDTNILDNIIQEIRKIKHVEIIRIGSRTLVTMPQRITDSLVQMLKRYSPIYINTHFNHPNEITEEVVLACKKLSDNGIVLGNQMVFLKGINNNNLTVMLLNQLLLKNRIRPYYIFHPKEIIGTKHFQISIREGLQIYSNLRGHTSGLAIPTYVYNTPKGLGKVALNPEILKTEKDGYITLTTWEGNHIKVNVDGGYL